MVLRLVVDVLHYMFRPTWPSSGVYDVSLFIPEGICFAAFVAFVVRGYTMQFLILYQLDTVMSAMGPGTKKGSSTV
jgi:hypothetical protein